MPENKRVFLVPKKDGMGRVNVCYQFDSRGRLKHMPWLPDALRYMERYDSGNFLITPETQVEDEIAEATERALAQSQGQGFARNSKKRKAVEDFAMTKAETYYKKRGFNVTNCCRTQSYDLICVAEANEELHVEVKGTTTNGGTIFLTENEVKHARSHTKCALIIVHSIRLLEKSRKPTGGKLVVIDPWTLSDGQLRTISYAYTLKNRRL